jgi:hygromycin-B 7''-O-kinase
MACLPEEDKRVLSDITPDLKRRLLLHRASHPVRSICIEGWRQKAADLHTLQDLLWPI